MMNYGSSDPRFLFNSSAAASQSDPQRWLTASWPETGMLISTVLYAMASGIIFIFSNTVMPSLATLKAKEGITLMNTINNLIVNPLFALVFFGGLGSVVPACQMLVNPGEYSDPARYYSIASTAVFFLGEFVVTMSKNVPMNNVLQVVDPESEEGATYWKDTYLTKWVKWNTARGVFSALAAFLGGLSLSFMAKGKN